MEFITEERTYLGLDRVEVAELAPAGSPELARHAVHALGDRAACLLARHGVLAVGARPRDAVEVASAVEHQAVVHNTLRATNTTFKRNEDNNAIRI
jgi:ribulose-5-phosphate 4-epimerase/fuculose-1-phosphate aldolase